ncbi:MAG: recombination protein RecR [Actinomycetia bacterium]|nr:recombination protein RecR [Actinomycetes bacterium]
MRYVPSIEKLIEKLERFPGVGPKTAQRLALFILKMEEEDVKSLAEAIVVAKSKVKFCKKCFCLTDEEICAICRDDRRDNNIICVVEEAKDMLAMEKVGEYKGLYHVLQGAISPIEGIGPDKLKIKELLGRIKEIEVEEIILATNSNVEGEVTAMYLTKLLKPLGIKVTRLASGLPVGSDIEYADEVTLGRALEGRREI